jgi:hypothetical protein
VRPAEWFTTVLFPSAKVNNKNELTKKFAKKFAKKIAVPERTANSPQAEDLPPLLFLIFRFLIS